MWIYKSAIYWLIKYIVMFLNKYNASLCFISCIDVLYYRLMFLYVFGLEDFCHHNDGPLLLTNNVAVEGYVLPFSSIYVSVFIETWCKQFLFL